MKKFVIAFLVGLSLFATVVPSAQAEQVGRKKIIKVVIKRPRPR